MWPWSRRRRPMQVLHRSRLEFLGEQDGPAEREWKVEVVSLLAENPPPRRAYLARVQYPPETAVSVALCLTGSADPALVAQIGRLFAASFGRDQHLDILFLDAEQESRLAQVCRAFHPPPGSACATSSAERFAARIKRAVTAALRGAS